jgi:alkylated DNA repair dioxygenase AlkB
MNLFSNDTTSNLLPLDGEVNYFGKVMNDVEANHVFDQLLTTISWKNDEAFIYGKHYVTKRKVAWYGDKPFSYAYSNTTKEAMPWTEALQKLKILAENRSKESYNSCLLNLYHSGEEGMAWHSDGERTLKRHGAIASFSLGAERKFAFKHKQSGQTVSLILHHGSLLLMKGTTQDHWLHRLPPTTKVNRPRINLTFRTIVGQF